MPRYDELESKKISGVTYTPDILADFTSRQIISRFKYNDKPLTIMDPAIGSGQLIRSLMRTLPSPFKNKIKIVGFDIDKHALEIAKNHIENQYPQAQLSLHHANFLDVTLSKLEDGINKNDRVDIIIANPPYVRNQIIGPSRSRNLSRLFNLSGRIDLYHAFLVAMSYHLAPHSIGAAITSNRFLTTKSAHHLRSALMKIFDILHIWDLGDTKLFDAAVLPSVLLFGAKSDAKEKPGFSRIYQCQDHSHIKVNHPIEALDHEGVIKAKGGESYRVDHGILRSDEHGWHLSNEKIEGFLANVREKQWGIFKDIAKIRVGVKTCADKVFIGDDWESLGNRERPELLKRIITHHVARPYKALPVKKEILYPHDMHEGKKRAVELSRFPKSYDYLKRHQDILQSRSYLTKAGRGWYELWVPQNPDIWRYPKLIFRDIAPEPVFWIDFSGAVVNGDCYFIAIDDPQKEDLLYLAAAIGNSSFIKTFHDLKFNNRLYAGRYRFMTQYVENYPLIDPSSQIGREVIALSKEAYHEIERGVGNIDDIQSRIDGYIDDFFIHHQG